MQALLGLLWLAPAAEEAPSGIDALLGRFADPHQTYATQLDIASLMVVVLLAALVWRSLRNRPKLLEDVAPALTKQLDDPKFVSWANRVISGGLVVIALCASINYFYGTRNNGVYVHRWDAFHTVIGVKYHKELGYFDLYKCAYAVDRAGPHHFRAVKQIRDLRTRKFVDREEHIAGNDCESRFTPERLEEFRHDLAEFGTWSSKRQWRILMKDKGFNGTPFYATVSKLLVNPIDVNLDSLKRLAKIDPFLMCVAFGVVGWAFGVRQAAIMAIFFCVFFPNRFTHMGGSILRFDYVAALLIGFAALKKDKWGLAGAMFAWATMVRVFPAIFAVGVVIKIASDLLDTRKLREEHWRFAGFYGGTLALCFVISLIGMDGGFENWRTWYENMKIHNSTSASFRVGFKHLFMLDGKVTGSDYGLKQANFNARSGYYWAAVACLMAPLLIAVRRLDMVSFAALFGVFGFFLLAVATRYYLGVVAILFLVDRKLLSNRYMLIMGIVLFAAAGFDFFYFELNDSDSLMYNIIVGAELTLVILLLGSWLLFNPSLLDVGDDPRLPTHVPAQLGAVTAALQLPESKPKKKKGKKKKHASKQPSGPLEADVETDVVARVPVPHEPSDADSPAGSDPELGIETVSSSSPGIDRPAVTVPDGPRKAVLDADPEDGEQDESSSSQRSAKAEPSKASEEGEGDDASS
ncbi:hypothetical protein [Enhygromyxa salina]|uniref:DUF2029 domain-containing protein n=1 Tax=Enhygromyxa salina TaxID=215803 RepID=A0A2S9YUU8_9BACT|nr:hypothetical protein [Enhygromyxa salina]PRQ08819.1 hypothetical protein ENSA7_14510 [Enhygromyxa salina]